MHGSDVHGPWPTDYWGGCGGCGGGVFFPSSWREGTGVVWVIREQGDGVGRWGVAMTESGTGAG